MILRRALPCFLLVVLGADVAAAASTKEKARSAADAIARSKLSGTISTVGFIAVGVGVGVGLILLIASPGAAKKAPSKESASVKPWIGLGQAGLRGSF